MKTVSMGTSEPERARAARRAAAAAAVTGACLTTSVTRGDSEMRWSRSCTHTRTWSGPRIVWGEGGGGGEDKCMHVLLGGVAEEEHLTRHCQCTHE